ncbi:MAG: P-loop NTPase fold protein [Allosphingosinicella sp.]
MLAAVARITESEEWADEPALSQVSRLIRHDERAYQVFCTQFYAAHENPLHAETLVEDLTDNVERTLHAACGRARAKSTSTPPVVTVTDFLANFPPPGSIADKVLANLGIKQGEIAEAADAATGEIETAAAAKRRKTKRRAAAKQNAAASAPPPPNDRVSTHADEPATLDELGRAAFADILAERIREARKSGQTTEPTAFIVHLHGPWGSGKSSVLNFLEENLSTGDHPWIVVRFNAWRDQRLQPPWWRLITTIYYGARAKLGWRSPWLWLRWLVWRVRADYMPLLSVLAVAAVATFLLWRYGWLANSKDGEPPDWMDVAKWLVPLVITLLTAIYVNSRSLALGSRRAAQTYADLKDDPFKPIARLFNQLVHSIARPLVVFIDDLDRCDGKYVVELLEGIQTLMRGAPVTYVVAADRKWICSSFEQRYSGFSPSIGESGRPLGYLFLDKLFQVSAAIPQIPPDVQSSYWARLLSPEAPDPRKDAEARAEAARQAEEAAGAFSRQEDLQALVQEASESGDKVRIQAVRAACAKRISSPEAVVKTEHRLQAFAHLLEPNPRAMKRLVNAYAMHQATLLLAGRETGAEPLARWTILELRWPLLADFLAVRCECVDALRRRLGDDELPQVPDSLRCLFGDELVQDVIGEERGKDRLSTEVVKTILGAVQGDR